MNKVFLYLYPIKEYISACLHSEDNLYDGQNIKNTLLILNDCIQKRYRDKGYQVVFVLYPDKGLFGIIPDKTDKIIYTDILFSENSTIDEHGNEKKDFIPKYPNEQLLIHQLGNIEELVIGGYHFSSCVKRVGEIALKMGINTIVDLDLTDLFFYLYRQEDYFDIEKYDPNKFKKHMINDLSRDGEEFAERQFNNMYSSIVYGFDENNRKKK